MRSALETANRGPEASCSGRSVGHDQRALRCISKRVRNQQPGSGASSGRLCKVEASQVLDTELADHLKETTVRFTETPPYYRTVGGAEAMTKEALQNALQTALREGCEIGSGRSLEVAVLLSGGVDSSLALHLLKQAGHKVTAFYLQIWFQEDFANFWGACPWEDDLQVCQEVCKKEGVPLEIVPLTKEYWDRVVSDSIDSIKNGFTPNPDILCNSRVKFGAFYQHLHEHYPGRFERIASGHYAKLVREGEKVILQMTPDAIKDQTYFLASLSQEQLSKVMFPLGSFSKAEVRQLATAAQLPNNMRRDSQGICFLGKVRFEDFVQAHLGKWPGPLVDEDTNEVVGFHDGFWFYTLGQRKGIFLSGGPWYVSRKDCRKNVVYISRQYYTPDKIRDSFHCGNFNWISGHAPTSTELHCKVRHGPQLYTCHFWMRGSTADVRLGRSDQGIAAGQYAVFYQDSICLGSATIFGEASRQLSTPAVANADRMQLEAESAIC